MASLLAREEQPKLLDHAIEDIDERHRALTTGLVDGYIRSIARYVINDVNILCMKYYGVYHPELILIKVISSPTDTPWFEAETRKCTMKQYIDDKYDIKYEAKKGFQCVSWRGFIATNKASKDIYQIKANQQNNFMIIDDDDDNKKDIEDERFHLMISEPLKKNNSDRKNMFFYQYLIPKHADTTSKDAVVDMFGIDNVSIQYDVWQDFDNNLWDLFVTNRLYDDRIDIKQQEIWKIIQFLSIFYFQLNHKLELIVPKLILCSEDAISIITIEFDEVINADENNTDIMSSYRQNSTIKSSGFENFVWNKHCNAEIIEYKKEQCLKCKCYLYANWGTPYWSSGGININLYVATFSIMKIKNEIQVTLKFENVINKHRRARFWS